MESGEHEGELKRLAAVEDAHIDIARTALLLASLDRPQVPLTRYYEHLDEIAAAMTAASAGEGDRTEVLRQVLVEGQRYMGDTLTYDDVQNANLMRVIDRRKGLPVALGILFIHAAESAGWDMVGISFPYYFLVRLEDGAQRVVLDPFKGGEVVEPGAMRHILRRMSGGRLELKPEFHRAVGKREVLMRLQNNIKTRALQARDPRRAAQILKRMLLFAPSYASLWRELSVVQASCGNLQDAIAAAEGYLEWAADEAQRRDAASLLRGHKGMLN